MKKKAVTTLVALSLGAACLGLTGCSDSGSTGTVVPTPTPTPPPTPAPTPIPTPPPPTPTPAPGAPTFTKAFSSPSVELVPNATTTLTYTITNTSDLRLTGLAFFDPLPPGLSVANPNNLNNGCGGTLAAAPGANAISLVNGSLEANASCTISLDLQVTATAPGALISSPVTLSSNQAPSATTAAINLTLTVPAPTFTMDFVPNPRILTGGGTARGDLTFTITNNAAIPLTGLAFSHTLPPVPAANPLIVSNAVGIVPSATPTCGSFTITAPAGGTNIQFTGGPVAPGQTCTVTIPVQTTAAVGPVGTTLNYLNAPVTLTNSSGAPSVTAGPVTWTVQRN
jgi:uncharacterized repeat protein (TIGR01451 family)